MESDKKSFGTVTAIIIILILLVLGAVYFLSTGALKQQKVATPEPIQQAPVVVSDAVTTYLKTTSSSDEIDSIKADLNATDVNAIDADLQNDANLKL